MHRLSLALSGILFLSACSGSDMADPAPSGTEPSAVPPSAAMPQVLPSSVTAPAPSAAPILALEGLGELKIGKPVPAASSFRLHGAQASDSCLIYSSPAFENVYAIVEGGQVRRITVSRGSSIKLVEGVGVGSTEKAVLAAFPGFKAEPHKYGAAPGKYLTQPGNDPRLRFEVGEDGRVTDIHVGLKPQLTYVESCA